MEAQQFQANTALQHIFPVTYKLMEAQQFQANCITAYNSEFNLHFESRESFLSFFKDLSKVRLGSLL